MLGLSFAALLAAATAHAQEPVLLPADVTRSVIQNFPEVIAADAERDAAIGRRLSAEGAFDTRVESDVQTRLDGFYSGDVADVKVIRPLGPLGADVYGGYRISQGDFPIYEDKYYTDQGGEARIGIIFNLLRDRAIDARRAGILRAELGVTEAELERLLTRIDVQREALNAYWRWITNGQILRIYEDLLAIAVQRESALTREVRAGARAAIELTENAQNLTRRRELVRRAEQDLALAANTLSLYLRSAEGKPIVAERDQLPSSVALPDAAEVVALVEGRPDLELFDVARERIELDRRLAQNDLQPDLSFAIEGANDFGAVGPGGISRDPAEVIAGVTLSVPLGRRDARGRIRSANARLEVLDQEQRLATDRVRQELESLEIAYRTAIDIVDLTRTESRQAQELLEAEVTRFRNGASDFFLVNLREQTAANARIRLAEAERTLAQSAIALQAATLDLERLSRGGR
jgi:outer membrane protein TolC